MRANTFFKVLSILIIMILALGAWNSKVFAVTMDTYRFRMQGGEADFGTGSHILGLPNDFGKVIWDARPSGGIIEKRARVVGKLYIDKLGGGCARLEIIARTLNGTELSRQARQFCGPGWNANSADNQRNVDLTFGPNERLQFLEIFISAGPTLGQLRMTMGDGSAYPSFKNMGEIYENGKVDFGTGIHLFGAPSPAKVEFELLGNGRLRGTVAGVLFWDANTAGCGRLIIDFLDRDNRVLRTNTFNECAPAGGNANAPSNQTTINPPPLESGLLRTIRLRLGATSNGNFVGPVMTRTYAYFSIRPLNE